jgi:3-hydroxybutyryl-CoA dehydratase
MQHQAPEIRRANMAEMTRMDPRHGYYLEDLCVGMSETMAKVITDDDIVGFADITGDTNPVHLDQDFAAGTMFKARIAHGMLSASFISAVLGTRLPGPGCIYLSQSLRFRAPVMIGDHVVASATVKEVNSDKQRIVLETVCRVGNTVVVDGEAMLLVSRRMDQVSAAE